MATLSEIYKGQGKKLPGTVDERFADPNFAAAATAAGITKDQYKINSGNADLNTKISNFYGKSPTGGTTPAAAATGNEGTSSDTSASPTIKQIYNIPDSPNESPELSDARSSQSDYYRNLRDTDVDPETIRAKTIGAFQAEIDAVNEVFTEKLRQAKLTGANRVGSGTAIQARRGLLGSDFGRASADTIDRDNNSVYAGINAEKAAAIQAILGHANKMASDEIAAKTAAKEQGAKAYLEYLQDFDTRKQTNKEKAAQFILSQNIDIGDLTPDELAKTAKGFGVTVGDIKAAYAPLKAKAQSDAEAARAKSESEAFKILPPSAQEYEYAKRQGYTGSFNDYQTEDANRKRSIAAAGVAQIPGLSTAGGKPLNASQASAFGYADRVSQSNTILDKIGQDFARVGSQFPLPNALKSAERQQFEQATRNFVNAVLRRESGAAISPNEFRSAEKQYFPQGGDSPEVLQQKAQNRHLVYQNILREAGQAPVADVDTSEEDGSGGTIRVKLANGQTGSIDQSEFDPRTMTKL